MPRHMWIQKQNIGPVARSRHTMAFDRGPAARKVIHSPLGK